MDEDNDEAIRLDPQVAVVYNNRGDAYIRLGKNQRAIEDYDEAIRLDPHNADYYASRAIAYTFSDMDPEAQADVNRAVELGIDREPLERFIEELKEQR